MLQTLIDFFYDKDILNFYELNPDKYKSRIAGTSINIGGVYLEMGDYANALFYSQKGVSISKEIGGNRFLANGLDYIGKIHFAKAELYSPKSS